MDSMQEKILVTGGGGFIGHHLVRFLKSKGYWVRGVDIKYPEYSAKDEADEFLLLDLRDFDNCLKATEGIDKVYTLAADMGGIGFITMVKADVVRNNLLINVNMAEACRQNRVKRLFFSSSACAYAKYKQEDANIPPLKESDAYPADPEDGYGWEKLMSERMYTNFSEDHGLEVRIARYHNVFGPEGTYDGGREKAPAALARKVAVAPDGGEIEVWGDGNQTRSFLYVDDCVKGTYALMESDWKEPLNIGSDRLVTIDGLADMIIRISGKRLIKKHNLAAPQGVRGRNSDNTLCKQVLGWEPKVSLEEGLEKTYRWIEEQVAKKSPQYTNQKKDKVALITGIAGQDGSYLAELLLSKGYEVYGMIRWDSVFLTERIDHIYKDPHQEGVKMFLEHGDLLDSGNITGLVQRIKPDEIYHLGAMSHVRVSFDMPEYTANADGLGTLRIVEAIKNSGLPIKFYNASSSEQFGSTLPPQNENSMFHPRSPYACAKVFAHHTTQLAREAYGTFACNGILYNHESPRRGPTFVTRKITRAVARIKAGLDTKLYLGNLDAKRDWGFAPEYVEVMYLMLQQDTPDDYVVSTGESHSVREFLEGAFSYAGLGDWKNYVKIDPIYFRPADVEDLRGDARKAREKLGWSPKVAFEDLVKIMVDADLRKVGLQPPGEGDKILREKFPDRWWKVD